MYVLHFQLIRYILLKWTMQFCNKYCLHGGFNVQRSFIKLVFGALKLYCNMSFLLLFSWPLMMQLDGQINKT